MVFVEHCGVQEVNRMLQLIKCDSNVGVTAVRVLRECIETVLCTCSDEKATVNISFLEEWLGGVKKVLLEFTHEGVSITWYCFGGHAGATHL